MRSQVESGAELFARLNSKPSLRSLEDTLFSEGLQSTDVIEINGEHTTGKTLLLSQLLAQCILPEYYGSVRINGCNASVVLINTDHHFQISDLVNIMTDIVNVAYAKQITLNSIDTDSERINVVRNSLPNLHVIDCYHSEQFQLTLRTLDDLFLSNAETAILAIDSITAYYWQDCENNVTTIDSYIKKMLKLVRVHTNRFNVATIYTKPHESIIKCKENKSTINSTNAINYRIHLRKTNGLQNLSCILETGKVIKRMHYRVSASGVKWEVDSGKG
ncbi:X-ray repair cross complementing 2 [Halictus rubicundus]|uniref:X-ray repair cross complementing 2 n=1 Tax=Halictus rubicundus TaxID=77578 RepID=UPI004035B6FD